MTADTIAAMESGTKTIEALREELETVYRAHERELGRAALRSMLNRAQPEIATYPDGRRFVVTVREIARQP